MPRRSYQQLTPEEEEQQRQDIIAEFHSDCYRSGQEPRKLIDQDFLSQADFKAKYPEEADDHRNNQDDSGNLGPGWPPVGTKGHLALDRGSQC